MKNLDTVMKWEEAEAFFIETHLSVIRIVERQNGFEHGEVDGPMRREQWNNWTDALCKAGEISDDYRWMSTTTTTEEIRSFVENVVEETKKHIAKKLVESRKGMFELLIDQGFLDVSDSSEEVEELVLAALEKL